MPRILPGSVPGADIYAITDSRLSLGRGVGEVARAVMSSGVRILQYREKDKDKGEKLKECLLLREITREAGACFIVNDDVDIALLCGADGVHLGQSDLPAAEVRRLVGPEMIIGVSSKNPGQAEKAVADGADYIGVGPIFSTATKPEAGKGVTLAYLDWVIANIRIPYVAIGGINRSNIGELVRHGCRCCAMISDIVSAPDIPGRIEEIRRAMR
ncbi:MAG: thiamine phosphate synthase [Desulfovibrionaceae bacterium]|nr:thiamine phosphate synthase [Deltaproteobacteria bacterium]MBR5734936.1 thiamine phosphate synthase [Desulfovibrionaceae bacterium]